jgi:hypothetical protein
LKCPSRGIAFNVEGMLEKQRFILIVTQLKNKIMKPLMRRMLFGLRKLAGGYPIFFVSSEEMGEAKVKGV